MPQNPSNVRSRVADIFRAKERYLEDKRRREEAAERARRLHAEVFRDVVTTCALPVFEAVGESLAGHGLEHRIKVVGLLENDRYEPEPHATFEFRVIEDASANGPLLGRAYLRLATDVETKRFWVHTEIAGGPDTPFVQSASHVREAEVSDLDAEFFEDAVLELVERAVRSTYRDADDDADDADPTGSSAPAASARTRGPERMAAWAAEMGR